MHPDSGPKIKYKTISGRLTLDLDSASELALVLIQETLQRESETPQTPISKSVAARRALCVYADGLSRQSKGSLLEEAGRAFKGTYIANRKPKTVQRDRKF